MKQELNVFPSYVLVATKNKEVFVEYNKTIIISKNK